jgi:BirA family biotin operon repressor/biotin-[acetyl-CoA-carboxylase] ligase
VSEQLGISRTSVWKAVNKLRNEGHLIEAVTHRGYRLRRKTDALSETGIKEFLSEESRTFLRVNVFDSVNSTNDICLEHASEGETGGYAAVAGTQTGGRGRRGRSFFSPSDTGLYISLLLRPQACTADKALRFTTAAAVSVCEAIEKVYEAAEPAIKWVNDIYMRGRKVCGILTEASFNIEDGTLDYAVIGIGINVYTPESGFPEEIREIAGSVFPPEKAAEQKGSNRDSSDREASDRKTSDRDLSGGGAEEAVRNRLAAEVLNGLVSHCVLSDADCISEYRKRCMVPGREIDVITHSGAKRAKAHTFLYNL